MPSVRLAEHACRLILSGLLLASCTITRHPVGISGASEPVSSVYTVIGPVEESDCTYHLLFLPFGDRADTGEIIDQILTEKGGDALVGVTVEERVAVFLIPVMWSTCTIVNGVAVRNPSV